MEKTSKKVGTKDPKRQERSEKSHETYMKRLKEEILKDNQLPTPTGTDRQTLPTPSSTDKSTPFTPCHTTSSYDTYVYGVGIFAPLGIGVCAFFAHKPKNKKLVNEKQDEPPKRRHML